MSTNVTDHSWIRVVIRLCVFSLSLVACTSADDGSPGADGQPGPGVVSKSAVTALTVDITGVRAGASTVLDFSVLNEDAIPVVGLDDADLRFNIAKLIPGYPSRWQNYINRSSANHAVQGSQERLRDGYAWGQLVDHKNGSYTYTFATNITDTAATCPSPCTDAQGNTLDTSYQAGVTHRVTLQVNSPLPLYNAVYDFVPSGAGVSITREIVKTQTCNECHNQLKAHGRRIEVKMCVTCHNPGSWDNAPGNVQTVDFAVMIHKIHRGEDLPSVNAGTAYAIGSHDYSTVVFPYSAVALGDTRACTKCHDGSADAANVTIDGDNWKTVQSKAACASCHDDVYFGALPDPLKSYESVSHSALSNVTDPDDSQCITCHGQGQAEDVVVKHDLPNRLKAQGAKYRFKVEAVSNTMPGGSLDLQVRISVSNPTVTPLRYYNIKTDPDFACEPGTGLPASVSILLGWDNLDENNTGSGRHPGQPYSASVLDSYNRSTGACTDNANVVDNTDGTFTVTLPGGRIPAGITGSGRAALYGRVSMSGTTERVRIKAAYADYAITDTAPVARRQVVDAAKCNLCHDQVSLHGESRTSEPGVCVICHNPSATDVNRRPKIASGNPGAGFPDASAALDGRTEAAVDFKRLIHSLHAGAKTDYSGAPAHGIRDKGLVVYGYNNSIHDFSHVRFPGLLNDCSACHLAGTYELSGDWEVPTLSGILGSAISTVPDATGAIGTYAEQLANQADDLNITPTAAVCSGCHDGAVAKSHMQLNGALFAATQETIDTGVTLEACAICHGPGRIADVKVFHGVQ